MHFRETIFSDFFYTIGSFNLGIFFHIMLKGFIFGAHLTLLKKKKYHMICRYDLTIHLQIQTVQSFSASCYQLVQF